MSAQANIRNKLFDQKSPWYPEVSWILLINVKNMWVKKYPFVWEVCHHRPKLEIFSLTRSLHNHKSGFFKCCALINSFLFSKKRPLTTVSSQAKIWNKIFELKCCGRTVPCLGRPRKQNNFSIEVKFANRDTAMF